MRPHAFVAMPFGTKPGPTGTPVDFDDVYRRFIVPALKAAGCEPFRADQEQRAGDIRAGMFQELLVADLVVADLTLDNPNVWYELGVRHALRARGVVLVQGPRPTQPFDTYTDRKLVYAITPEGKLDPARLKDDVRALATMVRATLTSSTRRKVSPVYQLLPHLEQPQWRHLLLAEDGEFAEAQRRWDLLVETARQKRLPGNVLLLAGETPTRGLRMEGRRAAAKALLRMERFDLALEQFREALEIDPRDPASRERSVTCLLRLERIDEARELAQRMAAEPPAGSDAWALLGQVEEERWRNRWWHDGLTGAHLQAAASEEDSTLAEAVDAYRKAFAIDPRNYTAGIGALSLLELRHHLGGPVEPAALERLAGGVHWACLAALERDARSHWARACYALYCLLREPIDVVRREFHDALATADGDAFALRCTLRRVEALAHLGWRPDESAAALGILRAEEARQPESRSPRKVLLFSGLPLDRPSCPRSRFPPSAEPVVREGVRKALDDIGAEQGDLALAQAAAGGDLIFLEECQRRGMRCEVLLPVPEPDFVEEAVAGAPGGPDWRRRYLAMRSGERTRVRIMPDELGPPPPDADPLERCGEWMLLTALAWGPRRLHYLCLCDADGSDGGRSPQRMREEAQRRTGQVIEIRVTAAEAPENAARPPPVAIPEISGPPATSSPSA